MVRLVKTSSFRLASLYAVVFAASTGVLFAIVFWIMSDVLRQQVRFTISAEMSELVQGTESKSTDDLLAKVDRRAASPSHGLYYGLYDKSGIMLAGNLSTAPRGAGWQELTVPNPLADIRRTDVSDDTTTNLLVLNTPLKDGAVVSVAFDNYTINEAQEAIAQAFAWAGVVGVILALFGGVFLSRKFLERIDALNKAVGNIIDGQLDGRLTLTSSHDELDQLGSNFNKMLDRLQKSMEGLKQVSGDIAHDLRTPLSRLKQCLETARTEATNIEDYVTAVDEALQHANTALTTFAALLRIAQIEAGTRRENFTIVDLSALTNQLAATYAEVAEDMGKSIGRRIAPDISLSRGDQELLLQMFVNLIENALRHTPDGTRIDIVLRQEVGQVIAEICDNGAGIPESERDKIFQRFYRLDASRTTSGNGMGLALVHAIAELHGSTVAVVDNHPGAAFVICFPTIMT